MINKIIDKEKSTVVKPNKEKPILQFQRNNRIKVSIWNKLKHTDKIKVQVFFIF